MSKTCILAELRNNMAFEMNLDGHNFITDASEEIGGNNLGPRPKQMLLAGLIGCTGIDVMSILNKMKVKIDSLIIKVEADNTNEHPKVYENIHLIYTFKGENLSEERINRAVELSQERYCGVSAMLKKVTTLTYETIIVAS